MYMYLCMHVYAWICMYVCVSVCMHKLEYAHMGIYVHKCGEGCCFYICAYVSVYVCIIYNVHVIYVSIYLCMYSNACILYMCISCTYVSMYIRKGMYPCAYSNGCIHTLPNIYTRTYMHIHAYTWICIYICGEAAAIAGGPGVRLADFAWRTCHTMHPPAQPFSIQHPTPLLLCRT